MKKYVFEKDNAIQDFQLYEAETRQTSQKKESNDFIVLNSKLDAIMKALNIKEVNNGKTN